MSQATPRSPDPRFLAPTPFSRLVATHAASAFADACVAVSLAGSLFFASPTSGSREKLLLYLLISFAPFAIVWPILGPALDRTRGGRRLAIVFSMIGRSLLCVVMSQYITKDAPEGLLVFPLAFGVLVLQKGHSVAKSSLVPSLVDDEDELVRANSRLALISTIATVAGGAPAALVQWIGGADWSLILAALAFTGAAVLAIKIPRVQVAPRPAKEVELEAEELHQPSILLAGSAMAVLRTSVGFLAFFSAFALKEDIVGLGIAATFAIGGVFLGNFSAPMVRERVREEVLLASAIVGAAAFVGLGALVGGVLGFALSGLSVGMGAALGKLGFDSLLQRDGPDAVRGRAFAKFETRFQLAWVIGALLGIIPLNSQVGLLGLAALLIFTAVSYVGALRAARGRVPRRTTIRPQVVDRVVDRAKSGFRDRRTRGRSARRKTAAERRAPREGRSPHAGEVKPPLPKRPARTPGDPRDPGAA